MFRLVAPAAGYRRREWRVFHVQGLGRRSDSIGPVTAFMHMDVFSRETMLFRIYTHTHSVHTDVWALFRFILHISLLFSL